MGDDVAGYEDIVKDFKSKYDRYKNTEVRITKFANYSDYEKTLLNVIADGNSPDVFMVPSDGAGVLESKIEPIPDEYVRSEDFGRNFNRVFDSLVSERQEKDKDGKDITVSYLKGVPLGYETMAAYYNLDIVTNAVPRTWKELAAQSQE
ncbi:MAG: extracellular solute-binding protein [Patescibacteria group bacterium]